MSGRVEDIQGAAAERERRSRESRSIVPRVSAAIVAGLFIAFFAPFVPFVAGVLLLIAMAVHTWSSDLRPYLEPILRIPVASPRTRHTRLALFIGAGVALIVVGSVSASLRGAWRGTSEQREAQRSTAADSVERLIARAKDRLATNIVPAAEIALLDALAIADLDPTRKDEIDDLLGRIQRSGDEDAIRIIVDGLSEEDLRAFEQGRSVPAGLDFGEPALTRQAVKLALDLLERRARPGGKG